MRFLSTLLFALLAVTPLAARSTQTTHIVNDDGRTTEIRIVKERNGDHWASFARNGVRYYTSDRGVLAEVEKAMEAHRELSHEHSLLGRRHSDLGREHSELGREHSRLGREHSRLGREASRRGGDDRELERQQRAVEDKQRDLEAKQRRLEDRQRELEQKQRDLEARQRAAERESFPALEQIFERAVREGKAKRE